MQPVTMLFNPARKNYTQHLLIFFFSFSLASHSGIIYITQYPVFKLLLRLKNFHLYWEIYYIGYMTLLDMRQQVICHFFLSLISHCQCPPNIKLTLFTYQVVSLVTTRGTPSKEKFSKGTFHKGLVVGFSCQQIKRMVLFGL